MKRTKKIYLIKISPDKWNQSLQVSLNFYPNKEDLKLIIEEEAKNKFYPKTFIDACQRGVEFYDIPKIRTGEIQAYSHWKTKGMTSYSSKGYTAIKMLECYQR